MCIRDRESLSHLMKNRTILMIAHRMRTVAAADQIVVLKDGRVAESGTSAELMERMDSIYHHMAAIQGL